MICKYTPVSRELDYRLSKWILKNIEQLLEPDEITGRAGNAGTLTGSCLRNIYGSWREHVSRERKVSRTDRSSSVDRSSFPASLYGLHLPAFLSRSETAIPGHGFSCSSALHLYLHSHSNNGRNEALL